MSKLHILAFSIVSIFLTACGSDDEDAARIVVGDSNLIYELNELQYQNTYVVQVTDTDGNPAPYSSVSLKVKPIYYVTGYYYNQVFDIDLNENVDLDEWEQFDETYCQAEDVNNNGDMDAGEDVNQSGQLEPTNSATVAAHPELTPTLEEGVSNLVTDEFGFGYFSLTYPKSEANWVGVEISAKAKVSGSENVATFLAHLPGLASDYQNININPPGRISPYGATIDDPFTTVVETCTVATGI